MKVVRNNLLNQFNNVRNNLLGLKSELIQKEFQASSGLRIQKPSDAPEVLSTVSRLQSAIADQPVYQSNIKKGRAILSVAETALDDSVEIVKRAQELATWMSSETYGSFERQQAATEVTALRERLISAANRDVAGRYVFSGKNFREPAYDATQTYQGTNSEPQTIIGKDNRLVVGFDGESIFEGAADPLAALADLATAMNTDDVTGAQNSLTRLEDSLQQILDARAQIGMLWNDADQAENVSITLSEYMDQQLKDAVGADPIEVYAEIATLRTAYEGALQVSAQSNRFKLLDYIR